MWYRSMCTCVCECMHTLTHGNQMTNTGCVSLSFSSYFKFNFLILCVWVLAYMYARCTKRPEEGIRSPGTGVKWLWTAMQVLGSEPKPRSSGRAASAFNCGDISPVPPPPCLVLWSRDSNRPWSFLLSYTGEPPWWAGLADMPGFYTTLEIQTQVL